MREQPLILNAGPAHAAVSRRGAEWREWSIGGSHLLWAGDPAVWPAIAPILFPVVGWTRGAHVRVGAKQYPLGLHGFAAEMDFSVGELGDRHARLILQDNPQTRARYPFAFRLEIEYRLSPTAMEVIAFVQNTGEGAMPYAVGLHPGFGWPFGDSAAPHRVVFDAPESAEVPVIVPGGLFSPSKRPVPLDGHILRLTPDLFAHEALCFLDVKSRKLVYDNGLGQGLQISLEHFPHVALWARPPAPFLAIEAWTGHGDPEGFDGDLFDKPSMIILAPGAAGRHAARYEHLAEVSQVAPDLQATSHLPKGR
jgi:galactose mutarotase-like enzyme